MTAEDRPVQSIVRRGTLSGMSDTRCCIGEGYTLVRERDAPRCSRPTPEERRDGFME